MKRNACIVAGIALVLGLLPPVAATNEDFEVTGPDGRRILLKKDGTWQYVDAGAQDASKAKPPEEGEAILTLERRAELGMNCQFEIRLLNNLSYEIRDIIPFFSAYRADGVLYETLSAGFFSIKPGYSHSRTVMFHGVSCKDIARLQVSGGDRCQMGSLNPFSLEKGVCLARVRVVESQLVRFEK